MLGVQNYQMFLLAGIALNITPGSDTIYILSRSIAQGRRAGIYSVTGVISGVAIHTMLATLGLSAILATSATAFMAVKMIGAIYLGYLGLTTLFSKENNLISLTEHTHMTPQKIYFQGVLSNVFNPKVALFFLSFLPQFIDPSNTYGLLPFAFLGGTFIITGTVWCLLLVLFSSRMTTYLRENEMASRITNKVCGVIYLALGVKILTAEK